MVPQPPGALAPWPDRGRSAVAPRGGPPGRPHASPPRRRRRRARTAQTARAPNSGRDRPGRDHPGRDRPGRDRPGRDHPGRDRRPPRPHAGSRVSRHQHVRGPSLVRRAIGLIIDATGTEVVIYFSRSTARTRRAREPLDIATRGGAFDRGKMRRAAVFSLTLFRSRRARERESAKACPSASREGGVQRFAGPRTPSNMERRSFAAPGGRQRPVEGSW